MTHNINMKDDAKKYVILEDKPSVGIVRGPACSDLGDFIKEILKIIVFFGGRQ